MNKPPESVKLSVVFVSKPTLGELDLTLTRLNYLRDQDSWHSSRTDPVEPWQGKTLVNAEAYRNGVDSPIQIEDELEEDIQKWG